MSTSASTAEGSDRTSRGAFLRARLASLLAVAPLSVWTIAHLWNNLAAFKGPEAWQQQVTEYHHPIAFFATLVVVMLPLVLHTIWGIGRLASAKPNNVKYKHYANLKYVLQRLSAIGVLFFLGAHIWLALLDPRINHHKAEPFEHIAHEMHHHGPTTVVYILGTLGVAYHLANGLYSFAMGWGVVSSRRALRRLDVGVIGLFLVLLAMSWGVIYALWAAGA